MSANNVIIAVPEEELIVSLYNDYLVRHGITNYTVNDTKLSVKAFSDYILEYLKDRYDLDADVEKAYFTDTAPLKDCKNTAESYGEICVKCNKCGRFDI